MSVYVFQYRRKLALLFILMDFLIHIDLSSMDLSILHKEGDKRRNISFKKYISIPEDGFYLSK